MKKDDLAFWNANIKFKKNRWELLEVVRIIIKKFNLTIMTVLF